MKPGIGVLIADDSSTFLRAGVAVVESTPGFAVLGTAGSGEQAIAMATGTDPDLVLLDVRMPGMGGVQAAARIHEAQPAAVVVLITAETSELAPTDGVAAVVDKRRLCPTLLTELWRRHGRPTER
jgi:two-component system invasion response regulator UvrY